jgi:phospholipase C
MNPAGIRHVVVLVQENQSFDRLLGYITLPDPKQKLEGLTGEESNPVSPDAPGELVRVSKTSSPEAYVTDPSPGHSLDDATHQIFGRRDVPTPPTPRNNGFVANYAEQPGSGRRPIGVEAGKTIMQCLDPDLVPVISSLARNFVVCDHWFSSVPGPTWPNRFFLHAGTANGLLDTPETPGQLRSNFLGSPYRMRSIFDSLMDAGHSWKVYYDDYAQAFALRRLHRHADRFVKFEEFARDVARGTLPDYAFIEPRSFSAPGWPANDQHPPHSVLEGERLIASIYDTLRGEEAVWRQSLFVLLYDEHGGYYDHVLPPAAVVPDQVSAKTSHFAFDRLGVRVPAILVSPWVGESVADHTVYDHTSLPATIKRMFGLPDFLTARDAAAATFDRNFLSQPRQVGLTNLSARLTAKAAVPGAAAEDYSQHQRSLLALAEVVASPGGGAAGIDTYARDFLGQTQGP